MSSSVNYPLISIVILNYNGRRFILDCLRTVIHSDYSAFEIIFVDNSSEDGSLELVRREFGIEKRLRIIANLENIGFASANNLGLEHSRGQLIIFLNGDTQVDPQWLGELAKIFLSHNDVGVAQCLLMEMNAKERIQGTGVLFTNIGWPQPRPKTLTHSEILPNILASGAAFVIRRDVANVVGPFDPDYFIGFEDIDLSLRVWLSGLRVVLAQKSIVYHFNPGMHRSEYVKQQTPIREFHASKNVITTIIKNLQFRTLPRVLPSTLIFTVYRSMYFAIKTGDPRRASFTFRGISWTLWNMRKILRRRYVVQTRIRKVSDKNVLKNIYINSGPT